MDRQKMIDDLIKHYEQVYKDAGQVLNRAQRRALIKIVEKEVDNRIKEMNRFGGLA